MRVDSLIMCFIFVSLGRENLRKCEIGERGSSGIGHFICIKDFFVFSCNAFS